ncbi:MAG: nucleotide pyrophosphohydrolase [Candidatus Paceibacterota bacterium]|jgi:NTP pyrophosphatase (non-canonical NTP hydrolase)
MKKLEKEAKKFLKERGWDKLRPSDLAKSISIESAELLELFQWTNPELEKVKNDANKLEEIKKELADVFLYSIYMSISLGFNTEKVILDKLKYVSKKFPPTMVKNKGDKEPGTEDVYHKIKKSYRRKGWS